MANGVLLLMSGQYVAGSFSGYASIRLMAARYFVPVNFDLIPNYNYVCTGLKFK